MSAWPQPHPTEERVQPARSPALRLYPPSAPAQPLPLSRYLPPLPQGMLRAWLAENVSPGGWLLDPLGASPALVLEAARAGYRVIVACNNPVLAFMLEVLASAPPAADFEAALAELALARRGEDRLDAHLRSLYLTECANCGELVLAEAFLWHKGDSRPYARIYHCPFCGEAGERPASPTDADRLDLPGSDALHRSRALYRVVMNEDEYREDVEQALASYLPRPLYVLFTLINKLEGLGLPPERLRLLHALLLSAFDAGNTVWPWPGGRARPRQLTIPPQFRENNLWLALEEAVSEWSSQSALGPVPLVRWPDLPPEQGGICLYRGRMKTLTPLPEEMGPQAIFTAFPRPSQAFWTLSVLWSGWLWGGEAALPLRNVLDRRRYDWNWHTSALHTALASFSRGIPPATPFFGLLPELAPGFLNATLAASEATGFHLQGLALRAESDLAQALWKPTGPVQHPAVNLEEITRQAIRQHLLARNEPAPYLTVYAAGIAALAQAYAIPKSMPSIPGDLFTRLHVVLTRAFADRRFLKVYGASGSGEEERGWWWLANAETAVPPRLPLADQIEMEVVRYLQKHASFSPDELDEALCFQFPGLFSPPGELVRAGLESYGEPLPAQPHRWRMRSVESPAARKADLQEMRAHLEELGRLLDFQVQVESDSVLRWLADGAPAWRFYLMASSIISRFVLPAATEAGQGVLVLPGGRAPLLAVKLRRDPRLSEAAQGWQVLKFRHLREIAEHSQGLKRADWQARLREDPLTDEAQQMKFLFNE